MFKPISSKSVIDFFKQGGFTLEPVYVKTPEGYVLELTKMAFMTLEDEDGEDNHVYPVLLGDYTDIEVEIDSSFGEFNSYLPPS